MLELEH